MIEGSDEERRPSVAPESEEHQQIAREHARLEVRDVMTEPVVTAHADESIEHVARLMLRHRVGCVVIVAPDDETRVVGIVTETNFDLHDESIPFALAPLRAPKVFDEWVQTQADLLKAFDTWKTRPVRDIMSSPVWTVRHDASVWDGAIVMHDKGIKRVPVLRDGKLCGIVSRHDLLKIMMRVGE